MNTAIDLVCEMERLETAIKDNMTERATLLSSLKRDATRRRNLLSTVDAARNVENDRKRIADAMSSELAVSRARYPDRPIVLDVDGCALEAAIMLWDTARVEREKAEARALIGVQTHCMSAWQRNQLQMQANAITARINADRTILDAIVRHITAQAVLPSLAGMEARANKQARKAQAKEDKKQAKYLRNLERRIAKQTVCVPVASGIESPDTFKPDVYALHGARVLHGTHNNQ